MSYGRFSLANEVNFFRNRNESRTTITATKNREWGAGTQINKHLLLEWKEREIYFCLFAVKTNFSFGEFVTVFDFDRRKKHFCWSEDVIHWFAISFQTFHVVIERYPTPNWLHSIQSSFFILCTLWCHFTVGETFFQQETFRFVIVGYCEISF